MKRSRMPKLVGCLRHYNLRTFTSDLIAGLTVGLVALPLAMAFAISSGVPPEAGLDCAVAVHLALGGSRADRRADRGVRRDRSGSSPSTG